MLDHQPIPQTESPSCHWNISNGLYWADIVVGFTCPTKFSTLLIPSQILSFLFVTCNYPSYPVHVQDPKIGGRLTMRKATHHSIFCPLRQWNSSYFLHPILLPQFCTRFTDYLRKPGAIYATGLCRPRL
jgi:hypothetical protein